MKTKEKKLKKEKYYLLKLLNSIFNILFYVTVFLIFLSIAVALIIAIVKVDVDHMILPPFMKRGTEGGVVENYRLRIGNGIRITVDAETITLGDIKTVIYSGLFLLIAILATAAPIIKFFAALMRNIVNGFPEDIKNIYYMYYIGLCLSVGGVIIKFVTRFYNYKLVSTFAEDSISRGNGAVMELDLNIDILYAVPGLLIIFAAFLFGCIRKSRLSAVENSVQSGSSGKEEEKALAEKKNKDDF